MLLVTSASRVFGLTVDGSPVATDLTARQVATHPMVATAQLTAEGLPVRADSLAVVSDLAERRVSVAPVSVDEASEVHAASGAAVSSLVATRQMGLFENR